MAKDGISLLLRYLQQREASRLCAGATDGELLKRFAGERDEVAFSVLLSRHGPMVLGVGRRLLTSPQDAEDVFQATFLTLARKASSISKRESIGPWLYGVASRIAMNSRRDAAKPRRFL